MNILDKRSEIIFCYDIKDANPNGDPLDSNKPRIDEETGENLVTDVRLKRTVRDYFFEYKNYNGLADKDIFVREIVYDDKNGFINDGKRRSKDFEEDKDKILDTCIDIRLFGGVLPLNKDSITFTGPVQFQMGRSMHKVNTQYIKGTGAFASGDKKKQATFREEHIVSYSFINFYGIINENAAKNTKLTKEDTTLLMEGIWEGTKNIISRSKFGQMPRLLVKVNYNAKGFYIGDLNKSLKLVSNKQDEEIRSLDDFQIDITEFKRLIDKYQDKIDTIEYKFDDRVNFTLDNKIVDFEEMLGNKKKEIQY